MCHYFKKNYVYLVVLSSCWVFLSSLHFCSSFSWQMWKKWMENTDSFQKQLNLCERSWTPCCDHFWCDVLRLLIESDFCSGFTSLFRCFLNSFPAFCWFLADGSGRKRWIWNIKIVLKFVKCSAIEVKPSLNEFIYSSGTKIVRTMFTFETAIWSRHSLQWRLNGVR